MSSEGKSLENKVNIIEIKEILKMMMHGYGDSKEPLEESVNMVLLILRDQMDQLLVQIYTNLDMRGGTEVNHGDVLFLLRKSKPKMKRLLRYVEVVDFKPTSSYDDKAPNLELCMEFLREIEDLEEYTSLLNDKDVVDPGWKRRFTRRYLKSDRMSTEEFLEYNKNLQVSFRNAAFKKWLFRDLEQLLDTDEIKMSDKIEISELAMELICYLARETVAEIVDMALIRKLENYQAACPSSKLCNSPIYEFQKDVYEDDVSEEDIEGNVEWGKTKSPRKTNNRTEKKQIEDDPLDSPITVAEIMSAMTKFQYESSTHPLMFFTNQFPPKQRMNLMACVPTPYI